MHGKTKVKIDNEIHYSEIVKSLKHLAYNLWWSWYPPARTLFDELSPLAWKLSNHNPVAVLNQCSEAELRARLGDEDFRRRVMSVLSSYEAYMSSIPECVKKKFGTRHIGTVAYFCMEFGLHECLPMYSGGLGTLAGDHAKSASDLGIPFVGVGLFYRQGYFQQKVDAAGVQQENYPHLNTEIIPVELVKNASGKPLFQMVEIGSSKVYFQAWRVAVGRSQIYLLDTDVPQNEEMLRGLTAFAYGGDVTTRIRQEIVLGIGGVRLLRALKIEPGVFHINEGHAAFLTLELLREQLKLGKSKPKAEQAVQKQCVFTTHTPVSAGHDRFHRELIEFTLKPHAGAMKLSIDDLMSYGQDPAMDPTVFTMTVLALRLSRAANAVSKKHEEVSRKMWKHLYGKDKTHVAEIGHVTNGVHIQSWVPRSTWEFWERHDSHRWTERIMDNDYWKHVSDPEVVSDEEIWALRCRLRRELTEFIRNKAKEGQVQGGFSGEPSLEHLLSPDVLTIGFARRFAPYKRAPLIFHDITKAYALFNTSDRPLQIIFAGKAHPRDNDGKAYLHKIIEMTHDPRFFGKVIFLENYDIDVARHLVSGCDIWLNAPRKPLEASGTSGEKVIVNCGLNASVLDGWWMEAYNRKNGWAIGDTKVSATPEEQDQSDADFLYRLMHEEILPAFYQRDHRGIPRKWIAHVRNSLRTIIPTFNTHRMLMEYADKYYFPAE